jgi:hypothetical protein
MASYQRRNGEGIVRAYFLYSSLFYQQNLNLFKENCIDARVKGEIIVNQDLEEKEYSVNQLKLARNYKCRRKIKEFLFKRNNNHLGR